MQFHKPSTFSLVILGSIIFITVISGYLVKTLSDAKIITLPTLPSFSLPRPSLPTSNNQTSYNPSDYILAITSSVNNVYGTVDSINSQTIKVKLIDSSATPPKDAFATFQTNDSVQVNRRNLAIPYLLKQLDPNSSTQIPAKLSDIRKGDFVGVFTDSDIRLKKTHLASSILILQKPYSIDGTITKINGNRITVNGKYNSQEIATDQIVRDYDVEISSTTEISAKLASSGAEKPIALDSSVLEIGQFVSVYTDVDVSANTKFKALLIVPNLPPTFGQPATVSPSVPPAPEVEPNP